MFATTRLPGPAGRSLLSWYSEDRAWTALPAQTRGVTPESQTDRRGAWARPRPEARLPVGPAAQQSRSRATENHWSRPETSGPEQTRADPTAGPRLLKPAHRGSCRRARSTPRTTRRSRKRYPSRALSPVTCHEHHENRSAPLGRRDGRRNGALEPQHRSPQAQALARCVVAAVHGRPRPPRSPASRPRQPPAGPAPLLRTQLLTGPYDRQRPPGDAHRSVRGGKKKKKKREESTPLRHVTTHCVRGRARLCLIRCVNPYVRAPARPQILRPGSGRNYQEG